MSIEQALLNNPATTSDLTAEANAFYQQIFGENAPATAIQSFQTALTNGLTIQQAEDDFLPDLVYSDTEDNVIGTLYQEVTGDQADDDTIYAAEDAIYGGASLSDIRADFATSSDAATAIDALYRSVLGRGATATEVTTCENQLATTSTLADLRYNLARTPEAAAQINQVYIDLFGTNVDSNSPAIIQQQITSGGSIANYRVAFATNPVNDGGVMNEINAAYQSAVGRNATGEEMTYLQGRLANGLALLQSLVACARIRLLMARASTGTSAFSDKPQWDRRPPLA